MIENKIVIFTDRKIKEVAEEIVDKYTNRPHLYRLSSDSAKIGIGGYTIYIMRLNENKRGFKSRIILLDGEYDDELINLADRMLIDATGKSNTLLAPYGMLRYLLNDELVYIITGGEKDYVDIKVVTKDIVKAICYFNDNDGSIYCYKDETDELFSFDIYNSLYDVGFNKEDLIRILSK